MFPAGQSLTAPHVGSDLNVSGFGRVGEEGDDNVNTLYSLVWSMAETWRQNRKKCHARLSKLSSVKV